MKPTFNLSYPLWFSPDICSLLKKNFLITNSGKVFRAATFIFFAILKFKANFSCGPDLIPTFLIKNCATSFSNALHVIFNLALKSYSFLNVWNLATSTPIFKTGEKSNNPIAM